MEGDWSEGLFREIEVKGCLNGRRLEGRVVGMEGEWNKLVNDSSGYLN